MILPYANPRTKLRAGMEEPAQASTTILSECCVDVTRRKPLFHSANKICFGTFAENTKIPRYFSTYLN